MSGSSGALSRQLCPLRDSRKAAPPRGCRWSLLLFAIASHACAEPGDAEQVLDGQELASPAGTRSRLPRWGDGGPEGPLLSWIEEDGGLARLELARWEGSELRRLGTVASGGDWFVNWADFPSVAADGAGNACGHFLRRSASGTYDYQVQFVLRSPGADWSAPARLHTDAGPGEHGFVSLVGLKQGFAAVWLDGRNTGGHDGGPGAMALYSRSIDPDATLGEELALDERVCDCCPTSAVQSSDGALVVAYRDRSEDEVRDVSVLRVEAGRVLGSWSSEDGWKIAGCPVNGPVLRASGGRLALAWFTLGREERARVLCAFSEDGGRTFAAPVVVAEGTALGRVDAVFDREGRLVVTWLESSPGAWLVARLEPGGRVLDRHTVVEASAGRESGLARLAAAGEDVLFAWTDTERLREAGPRVRVRRLAWR